MKAASAAVAVLALVAAATFGAAPASAQTVTDVDILNFALNLEYLEAQFYYYSVYGRGIPSQYLEGGKPTTGGRKANLTQPMLAIATEIANDELNHVKFLRAALGDSAAPIPHINLGSSFVNAANAAFNMTLSPSFNAFANDLFFAHAAFIFEDVGVTAYKGAAALISNPDYLTAAAGILAVEAYHAGTIRSYLYENSNTTVEAYNVTVAQIVDAISALRATLSMADDDQGVVVNGTANIVPTDENSIVFSRTPAQVLAIVTFGSTNGTGGFFPQGLNKIEALTGAAAPAGSPGGLPSEMAPASAPGASESPSGSPSDSPSGSGTTPTDAPSNGASAAAPAVAVMSVLGAAALLLA